MSLIRSGAFFFFFWFVFFFHGEAGRIGAGGSVSLTCPRTRALVSAFDRLPSVEGVDHEKYRARATCVPNRYQGPSPAPAGGCQEGEEEGEERPIFPFRFLFRRACASE